MKLNLFTLLFLFAFMFLSCKKITDVVKQGTVKSTQTDFDVAVINSIKLTDGNFILAADDQLEKHEGLLIKINGDGEIIWKKSVAPSIKIIWSVIATLHNRFAVYGIDNYNSNNSFVCMYDADGNLLFSDTLISGLANYEKTPNTFYQLSNGNYLIGGGRWIYGLYTTQTFDSTFHLLNSRTYSTPTTTWSLTYSKCITQLSDGNLAVAVEACQSNAGPKRFIVTKTNQIGNLLTSNFFNDSIESETVNAIIPYQDGFLSASASMIGDISGTDGLNQGIGVNYYATFNSVGSLISGKIRLRTYNSSFQETGQSQLVGFPNNGMISSINNTSDGGFILCGTVDQLNTLLVQSPLKIYVAKVDADLNLEWSQTIQSTYPSLGVNAFETTDGGYLITGFSKSFDKRFEPLIIKTDANGNY